MHALGALASALCASCLAISTGTPDAGTATAPDDSGTAVVEAGSSTGGTGCGADPTTGVTLCLGTNACPNLTVDTSAFPSCGFRPGAGSAFDLECLCNGTELCPIGAPSSCDSATQLLAQQQSALQVCQQVSTGTCLSLEVDAGSGSGGGGTSSLSSACQACVATCGSTPACFQSCGC
jgi:hypothetical protein